MGMDCSISSSDLLAYVSGYITDIKKKGEPFTLKDVVARINNDLKDVFKDPAERIAHVRLVPEMIKDTMLDSEFYDYFTDKDLDHKALNKLIKGFAKDIRNVGAYLGETAEPIVVIEKAIANNENRLNQLPLPKQSNANAGFFQGKPEDLEEDDLERRRPLPTSTTGQSAEGETFAEKRKNILDPRVVPYDEFQKELVKKIITQGVYGNQIVLTGTRTVKGVYLTAVMGTSIPQDKWRQRDKDSVAVGKVSKEVIDNTVKFVITDTNGEFLYFDENNEITNNKGRLMIYDMRSDKTKLQAISRAAKNLELSIAETEVLVTQGFANNKAVRQYLTKNPTARIRSNVIGGTDGYVPLDKYKPNLLTKVDFKGVTPVFDVSNVSTGKRQPAYMKLPGIELPIQLNVLAISPEDASMISDFLTSDVYQKKPGGKEELVSMSQKVQLLLPILWSEEISRLVNASKFPNGKEAIYKQLTSVYHGQSKVRHVAEGERVWNLTDPDIASAPQIAPVNGVANGEKGIYWLQKVNYNVSNLSIKNGKYNKIELEKRKDGGFDLTTDFNKPSDYKEWIMSHTTTTAKLNELGQIVSMNPSLDYKWNEEDLNKINNVKAEVAKALEVIKNTPPAPTVAPVDQPAQSGDDVIKKLKESGEYFKRKYQKAENVQATLDQIEEAKEWWRKSPLSAHIPFEAMFNIINTAYPDAVAHWTSQGIVLFKGSDYSDLYHESWHGFTQTFLTKDQKAKLYGEARKLEGTFTDFKGTRVAFSKASVLQLEEYMAEKFREFMLSGGKPLDNVVINSIFQKILKFLRALFGKLDGKDVILDPNSTYMRELFDKLRVGDLNAFTFDMNNRSFAVLNKGYQSITGDKTRTEEMPLSVTVPVNDSINYLISDTVNQMNARIDRDSDWEKVKKAHNLLLPDLSSEEFLKFKQDNAISTPVEAQPVSSREYITEAVLLKNPASRAHIYKKVFNKIIMPGGLREQLYNKYVEAPDGVLKQQAAGRVNALDWAIAEFGDPDKASDLSGNKGVMAYNFRKSPFLTIVDKTQVYEELLDTEKDQGYEKQGNTLKLEMMFDPLITSFLKGLYQVDKNGDVITNEYGTPKPMNFKFAVNRLAHVLGRGADLDKVMRILKEKQGTEPVFTQIVNKLGPTVTSNDSARNMISLLWQAFNFSQVELLQLTQNEDQEGNLTTSFGVASSPTDLIARNWESTFSLTSNDTIKKTPEGASYLDLTAFFAKFPKFEKGKELEMLHGMGMLITDDMTGSVRKKLVNNDKHYGTSIIYQTLRNVHELERPDLYGKDLTKVTPVPITPLTSIAQIIGDFVKYAPANATKPFKQTLKNNAGRYSALLMLDSKYNEKSGHTVANAKDDPQQELTVPFFLTIIADTINSVTSWEELMEIPEMAYLSKSRNFPAKFSRILASIFDFSTPKGSRREDLKGIEIKKNIGKPHGRSEYKRYVELKMNNFSGIALTNKEFHLTGMAITDLTKLDALMGYLDVFVRSGNMMGPGHGAKSTTVLYHTKIAPKGGETLHSGKHYVDIPFFVHSKSTKNSIGREKANAILIDYINGELSRIHTFNALPASAPEIGVYKTGGEFTTFKDILSSDSKKQLIAIDRIKDDPNFTLEQYFSVNYGKTVSKEEGDAIAELYNNIISELDTYFDGQISHVGGMFSKVKFEDADMIAELKKLESFQHITFAEENQPRLPRAILEAFVYNTWMHTYEGHALFYGDNAQFTGQTRSKRDGAMGSPGKQADYSESGFAYINGKGKNARPYGYSNWNTLTFNGVTNNKYETYTAPEFGRVVNSAVLDEIVTASKYLKDNIVPAFEDEMKKIKNSSLTAKEKADRIVQTVKAYQSMKIADAAGVVTFDFYRILRIQNGTWWSNPRLEIVFQKIIRGESVEFNDTTLFHTVKLQYSGPLATGSLPMMANHKFMVVPLIPTMIKGKNWEIFHNQMVNQNVDYALFQSGSKTATITKDGKGIGNLFYSDPATKKIAFDNPDYTFTVNPVYLKYLKEQTATSDEYDEQATTSRQLRTLAIGNLMSGDAPIDFMVDSTNAVRTKEWIKMGEPAKLDASPVYRLIKNYEKNLNDKTAYIKERLLKEMGWIPGAKTEINMEKLLTFVRHELERKEQPEHIIDYIEINRKFNKPLRQFSLSPNAGDIEKILSNLVTKRIVNQKSNGQAYYMVSDVGHESIGSSESLPFYERGDIDPTTGKRRTTSMAGCRIALHGNFKSLLKLKHPDGRAIGTIERLNVLIRNKEWLAKGHNLDMISLGGIRIPGQGMNSVDILQVYEFLPEESGPVIMMHPEVVAKVGADYDNDKFPAILPNIINVGGKVEYARDFSKAEGLDLYNRVVKARIEVEKLKDSNGIRVEMKKRRHNRKSEYDSKIDLTPYDNIVKHWFGDMIAEGAYKDSLTKDWYGKGRGNVIKFGALEAIDVDIEEELLAEGELLPYDDFIKKINGIRAIENRILDNIKEFALLEQNYAKLVKPNGTFLLKPHTDNELKPYVADVDFEKNNLKENKGFSPTRIMEIDYNLTKLTDIVSAQQALGITMVALRWDPLFNRVGFRFNPSFEVKKKSGAFVFEKDLKLYFDHNYYIGDDKKKYISLSHIYDVLGELISDSISQVSNGNVDAETDAWAAFMQANKAATPVMMLMLKAGISRKNVMNFISMPLIRAYYQEQAESRGPNSRKLGKAPRNQNGKLEPNFYKGKALDAILSNPKYGFGMTFTQYNRPNSAPGKLNLHNALAMLLGQIDTALPQKIVLPIGISGSGKSTWIKSLPKDAYAVISPDEIRKSLTGNISDQSKNKEVFEEVDRLIDIAIVNGKQIILDATNLNTKLRVQFTNKLKTNYPDIEIQYKTFEVTPEEAKKRISADIAANVERSNVPDDVIDRQTLLYAQTLEDIKSEPMSAFTDSTVAIIKPDFEGQMTFNYGNNKRADITSTSTLGAIKKGERTATTRYEDQGKLDYWKKAKIGDIVKFSNSEDDSVLVRVTKPLHKLKNSGKIAENWSKLEGWSVEYFDKKVRPKLDQAWQIEYELIKPIDTTVISKSLQFKFTEDKLHNVIKAAANRTIGKDYFPTDYDKAAFLHFVEVEEMAKATRDITMRLTGDSQRSKNISAIWNKKVLIEELSNNKMFDARLVKKLLSDSPIASFDTNDFVISLLEPLFTLRDHPVMLELVGKKQKSEVFGDVPLTTGDTESYGESLINDFVGGYIFQNMLRGFDINKTTTYKGFGVNKVLGVKDIKNLKRGVDVVKDTLYVDKAQLKQDFEYKLFSKPVYKERGLAIIPMDAFPTEDEYYHFVYEREYIRSITIDKAKSLASTPAKYEEFLRNEALDNTFNMWKLFKSNKSYASQFQKIKDDPDTKHLLSEYSILSALIVDVEKNAKNEIVPGGFKNIKPLVRTSDLTKDEIDIYHEQLVRLSNISTVKANDLDKNRELTRFFKRLPFVAMLQSGMNTANQFSFVKLVPQNDINDFMEHKSDEWITLLDAIRDGTKPTTELELYYQKWFEANAYTNKARFRLKDFLVSQQDRAIEAPERLADQFTALKFAVEQTNLSIAPAAIKKLAESYPNKTFVWGAGTNLNAGISSDAKPKDMYLKDYNNSAPITVRVSYGRNQSPETHLSDDNYGDNIKLIEQDIANLIAKRDAGGTLVFNESGYGQALIGADDITGNNIDTSRALAPQTFAYLSRRLNEEFNYVNRNFLTPALYKEKVIDRSKEIAEQDAIIAQNEELKEINEGRIIMSETDPNFVAARNFVQKNQPSSDESVRYRISTCFT